MQSLKFHIKFVLAFSTLFCLLTAIAVINTVTADEAGTVAQTISHSPSDEAVSSVFLSTNDSIGSPENTVYVSPVFTTDFTFNGIGLTWAGSTESEQTFYLSIDGKDWIELQMVGDEAKDKSEQFVSHPVFASGDSVQYKMVGDVEHIQNVRITYFDSTTAPEVSPLHNLQTAVHNITGKKKIDVITREEWGADESYRYWEPSYIVPEKFIIHHTAGGDGGSDPAATVRGIYYWHAVVLGWGDIGYNYIVDQEGSIYEGRYGGNDAPAGDTVAGAHAYNSISDLDYNQYSIGIAILGCFEDGSACNTTHDYSAIIQSKLSKLIGTLAYNYKINPKGSSKLFGEKIKNIIGHRDVDYTLCPGNTVHDKLKTIRKKANNKYKSLKNKTQYNYQGKYKESTLNDTYKAGEEPEISITYNNTGKKIWSSNDVVMQVNVLGSNKRQRVELSRDIAASSDDALIFSWIQLPNKPGTYTVSTRLYRKGKPIKGTNTFHEVTITNSYRIESLDHSFPLTIKHGWKPTIEWTMKNTGDKKIPNDTEIVVNDTVVGTLKTSLKMGQAQSFTYEASNLDTLANGEHDVIVYLQFQNARLQGSRAKYHLRVD